MGPMLGRKDESVESVDSRRGALRAGVAVSLVLLMLSAGTALAAPREFYGTVAFRSPTAREFDRMGAGRVGTFRANLSWAAAQPHGPASFNWAAYDAVVRRAARNRIRVLATIVGTPSWAGPRVSAPPRRGHRDEFGAFVRFAVQRYGTGGDFWAANPGLPELPIRWWEVWNEENSPSFWTRRPSAKRYKRLLAPAARAIHRSDPAARVVVGGLFPTPYIRGGISMVKFLKGLYRAGARRLFDAVAVHPYALTPPISLKFVDDARRVMRKHGDGRSPVWITEVGWASSGRRTALTVKPKVQARYLRQLYTGAARSRKRRRIAGVAWFSFRDLRARDWLFRTGLLTASGKAKPSWKAFVRLTGGRL